MKQSYSTREVDFSIASNWVKAVEKSNKNVNCIAWENLICVRDKIYTLDSPATEIAKLNNFN